MNQRQSLRRLVMMPAVHVSLGPYSNELLFDLSEGGFSVYGRPPTPGRDGFQISLTLPGSPSPIRASGEIAWSSKSRNRTGIRFTEISRSSLHQLKNWMDANLPAAAPYKEYYNIEMTGRIDQLIDAIREGAFDSRLVKRSIMIAAILISAFLSGLVLSDYRWRSSETIEASSAATVPSPADVAPTASSSNTSSNAAWPTTIPKTPPQSSKTPASPDLQKAPAELRADASTVPSSAAPAAEARGPSSSVAKANPSHQFVVQVGAMKERRNADALSASLQQKGFSVVRSRIAEDGIYRVAAGPYPNLSSANAAKQELQAQNLSGFVAPWAPPQ